jgi:hypothetical protein
MRKYILGRGYILNGLWPLQSFYFFIVHNFTSLNTGQKFIFFGPLILGLLLVQLYKEESHDRLGLLWPFLGVLLNFGHLPYFENDFYRYFFEGKVFFFGLNPYLKSPVELYSMVEFKEWPLIGYPGLTSIYPPLTIGLFAPFALLSLKSSLLIFSLFNGTLIWWFIGFLRRLPRFPNRYLPLTLIFLQREMCLNYHFELIAFLPFFIGVFSTSSFYSVLAFLLSFHLKFIGGFGIVWSLAQRKYKDVLYLVVLFILSFGLFYYLGITESVGLKTFQESWLFAPGFINFLYYGLSFDFGLAKIFSTCFFIVCLVTYLLWQRGKVTLTFFLFFMVGLFYFSPVYNAWYALWPGVILLSFGYRSGAWYLALSPLTYFYFLSMPDGLFLVNFLVHLPFFIFLWELRGEYLRPNHNQANQY